jgi:hypothetical protein
MKSIRNIALSALLTLGAFSAVTYTSCNKDECKDVVCQNGGSCVDGTCQCATGYEGTNCETEIRTKFVKTWTAKDTEVGGPALPVYTSPISKGAAVTDVLISDFSDEYFINDVKATISGNTITIPSQTPDNDNYKVSGTGTYNATDKKITWTYTITDPLGAIISYTGTWE